MRAVSLGDEDDLMPLLRLLPPLPAHGCHPCLRSPSLDSSAGAGRRRGQNQFATGLETGSVGPTINDRVSAFRRSSQDHTFDSSHRAGTGKCCTCTAQGEQKERNVYRPPCGTWCGQHHRTGETPLSPGLSTAIQFKTFVTAAAPN